MASLYLELFFDERPPSSSEIQYRFVGLPFDSGGIVHGVDGWITSDPDYPERCIPTSVAMLIAKAMPPCDFAVRSAFDTVTNIRSRMQTRARMVSRPPPFLILPVVAGRRVRALLLILMPALRKRASACLTIAAPMPAPLMTGALHDTSRLERFYSADIRLLAQLSKPMIGAQAASGA